MGLVFEHIRTLFMIPAFMRMSQRRAAAYRTRRLCKVCGYAYRKVGYYRRLFDEHGISPSDIKGLDDLSKIPITGRDDLREVPLKQLLSSDARPDRMVLTKTSGSSGKPLTIVSSRAEKMLERLMWSMFRRYFGNRIWDKGASIRYLGGGRAPAKNLLRRVVEAIGLYRSLTVSCTLQPEKMYNILSEYRPRWLGGYSGTVTLLADWMIENGAGRWPLKCVKVGGEVLTRSMKDRIGRAFGAPVYQNYGSHEFDNIAWGCRETGLLHTNDMNVIVEVMKEDGTHAGPGETGEIVVTSLNRFSMPFLRYRLGDIVTRGPTACSCGRTCSTIDSIQGRKIDTFILPDGRSFHPYGIAATVVDTAEWVKQYAIVQEKTDRVVLCVVPFFRPSEEQVEHISRDARRVLGRGVDFRIEFVSEIEPGPGGKFHVSRSLVARERV